MAETLVRVRSAAIGAVILLTVLIWGGSIGASFTAAVIAGIICWELSDLFFHLPDQQEKVKTLLGTAWLVIFANMIFPRSMLESLVCAVAGLFAYYLATAERHPEHLKEHFQEMVFTIFVLAYVVVNTAFLPLIRDNVHGIGWTLYFLGIVWTCDSAAYFVGRKFGKQKLYPLISPGKSVEGAAGGLLGALILSFAFKIFGFKSISWLGVIIIPIVIGTLSQIGDLCESFLKRAYGIKDTGKLLPGHGGMLDRFDGVVFCLPFMYFCSKIFSLN